MGTKHSIPTSDKGHSPVAFLAAGSRIVSCISKAGSQKISALSWPWLVPSKFSRAQYPTRYLHPHPLLSYGNAYVRLVIWYLLGFMTAYLTPDVTLTVCSRPPTPNVASISVKLSLQNTDISAWPDCTFSGVSSTLTKAPVAINLSHHFRIDKTMLLLSPQCSVWLVVIYLLMSLSSIYIFSGKPLLGATWLMRIAGKLVQ